MISIPPRPNNPRFKGCPVTMLGMMQGSSTRLAYRERMVGSRTPTGRIRWTIGICRRQQGTRHKPLAVVGYRRARRGIDMRLRHSAPTTPRNSSFHPHRRNNNNNNSLRSTRWPTQTRMRRLTQPPLQLVTNLIIQQHTNRPTSRGMVSRRTFNARPVSHCPTHRLPRHRCRTGSPPSRFLLLLPRGDQITRTVAVRPYHMLLDPLRLQCSRQHRLLGLRREWLTA